MRNQVTSLLLLFLLLAAPALPAQTPPKTVDESPPAEGDGPTTVDEMTTDGEVTLWIIRPSKNADVAPGFREAVKEALASEAGRHILDRASFVAYLRDRSSPVPACFKGLQPCVSPEAIAFDALDLSSAIRVSVRPTPESVSVSYEVVDRRGQVIRSGEVAKPDVRSTAFATVRDIFDATGTLTIETEPPGAAVEIDGDTVGTAPLQYRLGIGKHRYVLRLPSHRPEEGSVEITSGTSRVVRKELEQLPGTLIVQDAPKGAEVFVNDEYAGDADRPIDLPPGNYAFEVRAEGHETIRDAVTLSPGNVVRRSVPLKKRNPFLRDISTEAIILNNYSLRIGYEHGIQDTTFLDARTDEDVPIEFRGFLDENGRVPTDHIPTKVLGTNGLRVDVSYTGRHLGLVLLSASYLASNLDLPAALQTAGGGEIDVTVNSVSRLQVRPFQVFYRYIYRNFVPFVEGGIGVNFQWIDVEPITAGELPGPTKLSQTDAFWTIGLGGQYYFTPNFFALARYSFQDYFDSVSGADHLLHIGLGAAFPNVFGLETEPPEKL